MIGAFLSGKGDELDVGIAAIPGTLQVIGVQSHTGTVDIAISSNMAQSGIKGPMPVQQARTHIQRPLQGAKRAGRAIEFGIGQRGQSACLHINRGTESTRAISTGTHATLHLHILHVRRKVRQIDPKHRMTLGIVHRYAIGGHVDTGSISAPHPKCGITNAGSSVAGGDGTRSHAQQIGDILPKVNFLDFFSRNVGKGHWRVLGSARSHHLHTVKHHLTQRVGRLSLRISSRHTAYQQAYSHQQ